MNPLKQRDIPDESRPLAYMNFINTLGATRMGQKVMIGLGEQYRLGKDNFLLAAYGLCCGVTRVNNELRRVNQCLPINFAVVGHDEDGIIGGNSWRID